MIYYRTKKIQCVKNDFPLKKENFSFFKILILISLDEDDRVVLGLVLGPEGVPLRERVLVRVV